jgi:hypothetical protein
LVPKVEVVQGTIGRKDCHRRLGICVQMVHLLCVDHHHQQQQHYCTDPNIIMIVEEKYRCVTPIEHIDSKSSLSLSVCLSLTLYPPIMMNVGSGLDCQRCSRPIILNALRRGGTCSLVLYILNAERWSVISRFISNHILLFSHRVKFSSNDRFGGCNEECWSVKVFKNRKSEYFPSQKAKSHHDETAALCNCRSDRMKNRSRS